MLRSYLHVREGKRSRGKKLGRNIMNNKRDSPPQEKRSRGFDARNPDYSQFRNECKFPQIDICKLQRNDERENRVFEA
jgi:hypothetical protein